MIRFFFQLAVGLLGFFAIANIIGFLMPVLTHPIATVFFITVFLAGAYRFMTRFLQ
jgi:uncharacterized membrane protein YuzA (DUF378 family)